MVRQSDGPRLTAFTINPLCEVSGLRSIMHGVSPKESFGPTPYLKESETLSIELRSPETSESTVLLRLR